MTKEERAIHLKAFADNRDMFEAVRTELLTGLLGEDFSEVNWVFGVQRSQSDSAYGKQVKITATALEWIKSGFDRIRRHASSSPQPAHENRAR